jgi:Family of unknown function (DUF5681)
MSKNDSDGAVGYGRPPVGSRFKPGQSGNPRGRPKGTRNLLSDLRDELSEKIRIREGGKELRVSKQRAFVKSLVAAAVKGDVRATTALVSLCARAFDERDSPEERKNSPADDEILEDFLAREIDRRSKISPNSRPQAEDPTEKE